MIQFSVFPDQQKLAASVVDVLCARIKAKPNINLGLATGGTMESIYEVFCRQAKQNNLNLLDIYTFNLDEYIGLGPDHPQSYYYYMQHHLFSKLPFDTEKTHLPACDIADRQAYCQGYSDNIIKRGGLDLQLLGIGTNGHIGFNEPGTKFNSRTHVVELSEQTRIDNSRFFDNLDDVPNQAITLGLQDIFDAKEIILVATGLHKAEVIRRLAKDGISEQLPASVLRNHNNAHIYLDEQAATYLD